MVQFFGFGFSIWVGISDCSNNQHCEIHHYCNRLTREFKPTSREFHAVEVIEMVVHKGVDAVGIVH